VNHRPSLASPQIRKDVFMWIFLLFFFVFALFLPSSVAFHSTPYPLKETKEGKEKKRTDKREQSVRETFLYNLDRAGADLGGGCRGCAPPPP